MPTIKRKPTYANEQAIKIACAQILTIKSLEAAARPRTIFYQRGKQATTCVPDVRTRCCIGKLDSFSEPIGLGGQVPTSYGLSSPNTNIPPMGPTQSNQSFDKNPSIKAIQQFLAVPVLLSKFSSSTEQPKYLNGSLFSA